MAHPDPGSSRLTASTDERPPAPPPLGMVGEQPGDWIGPYKLLEVIGTGGFGVVFLAERREPMVQRVALKVIKPGMDSKAVIARFEQERQALAVMDHPNVAKVLDGGVTPAGRPFFVMEHVKGEPITTFCDRNRLTLAQRLELIIPVCNAVQHAHLKGIIHRDLKPSNILVATVGDARDDPPDEAAGGVVRGMLVKVIDFGVAKAISHTLTDKTIFTEHGQIIGTPEYMSPEQAEMGATDVDARTDVYSLGVVLYQLLSGELPFDPATLRAAGYDEVRRIIRDVDPPRPSTRLSTADDETGAEIARTRRTDRDRITGELKRELEWIPLKAMRKDRRERYTTPSDLADDVRRYLKGEPLEAGPESRFYAISKYLARGTNAIDIACIVIGTILFSAFPLVFLAVGESRLGPYHPLMYALLLPASLAATGVYGFVQRVLFADQMGFFRRLVCVAAMMATGSVFCTIYGLSGVSEGLSTGPDLGIQVLAFYLIHPPLLAWLNSSSYRRSFVSYAVTSTATFLLGFYSLGGGMLGVVILKSLS